MNKLKKIISLILAFLIVISLSAILISCNKISENKENLSDLYGKKIGVLTGTIFDVVAEANINDAELSYFDSQADMVYSLDKGIVDGVITDKPLALYAMAAYPDLNILDTIDECSYAYVFKKNNNETDVILSQMNEFLADIKANGELAEIEDKWIRGNDESEKVIEDANWEVTERVLTFATSTSTGAPFSYVKDGKIVGYDLDIAYRFCKKYGYGIKVDDYAFSAIITAVESGKADFGGACITVTEERKEKVSFSDSNCDGGATVLIKSKTVSENSLDNKKFALITGGAYEKEADRVYNGIEYLYCDSIADVAIMLDNGNADALLTDEPFAKYLQQKYTNFEIVNQLAKSDYAFAFEKNDENGTKLCMQMNALLDEMKESGELLALQEKWITGNSEQSYCDFSNVRTGKNEKLRLGITTSVGAPFAYIKNNEFTGYDVEIAIKFCEKYGYDLEIEDYSFAGLISAVQSGKADFIASCIIVTEERKEKLLFSDPDYTGGVVVVVNTDTAVEKSTFLSFIKTQIDNISSTFIRENRWKLFVKGIANTMLITVSSIVIGTSLGFVLFVVAFNTKKYFDICVTGVSKVIQGMPVVVLLMILFYVVFSKSNLSGVYVSIIGFSLIFTSSSYGMLKAGAATISKGQIEAALSLGFSKTQTLNKIVLPQALKHILPIYESEIVAHIKATSIVGYIAVQDLTKISDIVRSRTYEAFFPLIATALIYFLLEFILVSIVKRVGKVKSKK